MAAHNPYTQSGIVRQEQSVRQPFVVCVISGCQLVQCPISMEDRSFHFDLEDSIAQNTEHSLIVYSPNLLGERNNNYKISVTFDETSLDLGELKEGGQCLTHEVSLPRPAASISMTICPPTSVSDMSDSLESSLVDTVVELLQSKKSNPRQGSLSLPHISELLRTVVPSERVDRLLDHKYEGDFSAFIKKQTGVFTWFCYTEKEIKTRNLNILHTEPRVVLKREARKRENVEPTGTEKILRDFLVDQLTHADLNLNEVMKIVGDAEQFTLQLSPLFSVLMKFLQRHRKTFQWTTNPDEATCISLKAKPSRTPTSNPSRTATPNPAGTPPPNTAGTPPPITSRTPPPSLSRTPPPMCIPEITSTFAVPMDHGSAYPNMRFQSTHRDSLSDETSSQSSISSQHAQPMRIDSEYVCSSNSSAPYYGSPSTSHPSYSPSPYQYVDAGHNQYAYNQSPTCGYTPTYPCGYHNAPNGYYQQPKISPPCSCEQYYSSYSTGPPSLTTPTLVPLPLTTPIPHHSAPHHSAPHAPLMHHPHHSYHHAGR